MNKLFVTVTRNTILSRAPCQSGLDAFNLKFGHLDPDTPVPLLACLESNSVPDVIWALRVVQQDIRHLLPLIAADFAESVLPLFESRFPGDKRPRKAIETVRAFMRGEASREVLEEAWRDAAAADAAADAAAAYAANAANAADAAADAAAYAATYAATYAAAYAAAYAHAAYSAANAAYSAANAANAAANAANAANAADAERTKQVEILKRYFSETPL